MEISINDKKRLNEWFSSEDGKMFVDVLKDMHQHHIDLAEDMYLKVINPSEQISVQVNQATGIKEILDFIATTGVEVEERKKEGKESSEQ